MIPTQCHLWQKEKITLDDFDFETIKTYWDSSHFWRLLRKCKQCGQLYIDDTVEFVDWKDGNDEIYTMFIPVSEKELEKNDFSKLSSIELFMFSPRILWDKDGSKKWIGKEQ